ncbi:hypothetical protein [Pedobacter nutrimenti]|uniref:hypothetical protein n=1 Tax=Pedobacter nutrimenti TaxID=1241337 RepID=UPI002930B766|nr:hypothetical protein [Pedobacter nutrimenti]
MRNSAWYHKIWRKKLQQFPLDRDADSAWAEMKSILDKELPVAHPATKPPLKSAISKLISPLLTYVLPAAVMIAACGYFIIKSPSEKKNSKNQKKQHWRLQKTDTLDRSEQRPELITDSISAGAILHHIPRSVVYRPQLITPVYKDSTPFLVQSHAQLSDQEKIEEIHFHQLLKSQISAADIFASKHWILQPVPEAEVITWMPLSIQVLAKNNDYYRKSKQNKNALNPKKIHLAKKKRRNEMTPPTYNYGIEAGINKGSNANSFYLGLSGSYALTKHWLISTGLQINTLRQLSGEYSHPSYYRPDSLPPFKINDSRKVLTLTIPLLLEHRISKVVSLHAGPLVSLVLKQANKQGLVAPMADMRDTVYHSKEINQAISKTTVNQISIGFTGGLSLHLGRFDVNGKYQLLSPYKISNDLGSYKATYQTFQFGIGYRLK